MYHFLSTKIKGSERWYNGHPSSQGEKSNPKQEIAPEFQKYKDVSRERSKKVIHLTKITNGTMIYKQTYHMDNPSRVESKKHKGRVTLINLRIFQI